MLNVWQLSLNLSSNRDYLTSELILSQARVVLIEGSKMFTFMVLQRVSYHASRSRKSYYQICLKCDQFHLSKQRNDSHANFCPANQTL